MQLKMTELDLEQFRLSKEKEVKLINYNWPVNIQR
jgi:hypothetical protein